MTINILLNECLPKKLKYRIQELDQEFEVQTVPEMQWNSLPDGKLLSKGEDKFDVFITSDRNLSFQQPVEEFSIQVVLLKAPANTYEDLLPLIKKLTPVIKENKKGQLKEIN